MYNPMVIGGLIGAAVLGVFVGIAVWRVVPLPAGIEPAVLRRSRIHGLIFTAAVSVLGAVAALYLVATSFTSTVF